MGAVTLDSFEPSCIIDHRDLRSFYVSSYKKLFLHNCSPSNDRERRHDGVTGFFDVTYNPGAICAHYKSRLFNRYSWELEVPHDSFNGQDNDIPVSALEMQR